MRGLVISGQRSAGAPRFLRSSVLGSWTMNTNCSKEVIVPASAAAICISGPQSEAPAQATVETSGRFAPPPLPASTSTSIVALRKTQMAPRLRRPRSCPEPGTRPAHGGRCPNAPATLAGSRPTQETPCSWPRTPNNNTHQPCHDTWGHHERHRIPLQHRPLGSIGSPRRADAPRSPARRTGRRAGRRRGDRPHSLARDEPTNPFRRSPPPPGGSLLVVLAARSTSSRCSPQSPRPAREVASYWAARGFL